MDLEYICKIRLIELEQVLPMLQNTVGKGSSVLELGAGSGWQAGELSRHGYLVKAIDLPNSNYAETRVWPVVDYDGEHFPFDDKTFDAVFSSNVIEHVENLSQVNQEIMRVLKPDGVVVHIVPSATWCLWTIVAHYFALVKMIGMWGWGKMVRKSSIDIFSSSNHPERKPSSLRRAVFPLRHGAIGTVITEIFLFRSKRWQRLFKSFGWDILNMTHNSLFYTGRSVAGGRISFAVRRYSSRILGSSCHVFTLRKKH